MPRVPWSLFALAFVKKKVAFGFELIFACIMLVKTTRAVETYTPIILQFTHQRIIHTKCMYVKNMFAL